MSKQKYAYLAKLDEINRQRQEKMEEATRQGREENRRQRAEFIADLPKWTDAYEAQVKERYDVPDDAELDVHVVWPGGSLGDEDFPTRILLEEIQFLVEVDDQLRFRGRTGDGERDYFSQRCTAEDTCDQWTGEVRLHDRGVKSVAWMAGGAGKYVCADHQPVNLRGLNLHLLKEFKAAHDAGHKHLMVTVSKMDGTPLWGRAVLINPMPDKGTARFTVTVGGGSGGDGSVSSWTSGPTVKITDLSADDLFKPMINKEVWVSAISDDGGLNGEEDLVVTSKKMLLSDLVSDEDKK